MSGRTFVKHYDDSVRCAAAARHLAWLHSLESGVRLPNLDGVASDRLSLEHLDGRRPGPEHLSKLAETLGRLHATAYERYLDGARLDQPFKASHDLRIVDFVQPRRSLVRRFELQVEGLPAAIYKDSNIRNFLVVDDEIAVVDFDDLTLAPFGYDLAKLIVSTVMTYGRGSVATIDGPLHGYNRQVAHIDSAARCSLQQFEIYARMHELLTQRYVGQNGYRYSWSDPGS